MIFTICSACNRDPHRDSALIMCLSSGVCNIIASGPQQQARERFTLVPDRKVQSTRSQQL